MASRAIRKRRLHVSPDVGILSLADRAADVALVEGLAVDDQSAAVAFVRRFQSAVFGLAVSITRDRGLAEDVSQEVFVRAWRAAGSYDRRKASVLTWLLTITRNAAIDAIRTRRPIAVEDDLLDALLLGTLSANNEVEDITLLRLESDEARSRLRSIPPEQARAVVLAVIGGCTAAEVSARENIPLGTAKTRIRNGLIKLRVALKEEESRD
ncbi:MAG TPA: sigma-70 family RNA polymerase sigma factor [Nocardioidaceae bacterium]|nr:sigma-70 family RNA polymerase sigma factor [Nocardioidaceae bacterium]